MKKDEAKTNHFIIWLVGPFVMAGVAALILCGVALTMIIGILSIGPESFPEADPITQYTQTTIEGIFVCAAVTSGIMLFKTFKVNNSKKDKDGVAGQ